jgi:predicted nicotinamide N-methyase
VGIALAELFSHCSVLLTDLDEVEEIVMKNIAVTKPAPSSQIRYQPLDWDEKLPDDLCDGHIDLVLVSDCTYNADSLPALVNVLDRLVQMSPDAVVLVALKRRHDSEEVFFSLMDSVNLFSLHKDIMQLPSQHDQFDEIELYCYGRKDRQYSHHCKPIMAS